MSLRGAEAACPGESVWMSSSSTAWASHGDGAATGAASELGGAGDDGGPGSGGRGMRRSPRESRRGTPGAEGRPDRAQVGEHGGGGPERPSGWGWSAFCTMPSSAGGTPGSRLRGDGGLPRPARLRPVSISYRVAPRA